MSTIRSWVAVAVCLVALSALFYFLICEIRDEDRNNEIDMHLRAPELVRQWARDLRVNLRAYSCPHTNGDVVYCDVTVESDWEGVAIHKLRCARTGCMLQR